MSLKKLYRMDEAAKIAPNFSNIDPGDQADDTPDDQTGFDPRLPQERRPEWDAFPGTRGGDVPDPFTTGDAPADGVPDDMDGPPQAPPGFPVPGGRPPPPPNEGESFEDWMRRIGGQIGEAAGDEDDFMQGHEPGPPNSGIARRFGGPEQPSILPAKTPKKSSRSAQRIANIINPPPEPVEEPPEEVDITPPGQHPTDYQLDQDYDATRPPSPTAGNAEMERWMQAMQGAPRPPWLPPGAPWPPPMDPGLKRKAPAQAAPQRLQARRRG